MAAEVPADVYVRNLHKIFRGHDGDADSIGQSAAMIDDGSLTRQDAFENFLLRADDWLLHESTVLAPRLYHVLLGSEPPAELPPGLAGYELMNHTYTLVPRPPAPAPAGRAPSARPPSGRPPAPSAERDLAAGAPLPAPRPVAAAERAPSARPPSVRPASVRPPRPPPHAAADEPAAQPPAHGGGRAGCAPHASVVVMVATAFAIIAIVAAVFDMQLLPAHICTYDELRDTLAASKALFVGATAAAAAVVGL